MNSNIKDTDTQTNVLNILDRVMKRAAAAVAVNESDNHADIARANVMLRKAIDLLDSALGIIKNVKDCNVPTEIVAATISCVTSAQQLFESKSKFRGTVLAIQKVRAGITDNGSIRSTQNNGNVENCDTVYVNSPNLSEEEAADRNDYNNHIVIDSEVGNSKDVNDK